MSIFLENQLIVHQHTFAIQALNTFDNFPKKFFKLLVLVLICLNSALLRSFMIVWSGEAQYILESVASHRGFENWSTKLRHHLHSKHIGLIPFFLYLRQM